MTTPTTDQAEQTFVDSERGLLIAVLLMVVLAIVSAVQLLLLRNTDTA